MGFSFRSARLRLQVIILRLLRHRRKSTFRLRLRFTQFFCCIFALAFATASALRQSGFATAAPPLQPFFRAASRRLRPPLVGRSDRHRRFIVRPSRPPAPCLRVSAFISCLDSGSPSGAPPSAASGSGSRLRRPPLHGRLPFGCLFLLHSLSRKQESSVAIMMLVKSYAEGRRGRELS